MLSINSGHFLVGLHSAPEMLSVCVICLVETAEWQAPMTPQPVMSHHSLAQLSISCGGNIYMEMSRHKSEYEHATRVGFHLYAFYPAVFHLSSV